MSGHSGDVFADTYYFLSLLSRDSEEHERAVQVTTRRTGRMVTTSWVLLEVANSIAPARTRGAFTSLLTMLRSDPSVTILPPDAVTFNEGVQMYESRADKAWSLTDCISFIVMEREKLTDALTADHHFTQAGFNALMM